MMSYEMKKKNYSSFTTKFPSFITYFNLKSVCECHRRKQNKIKYKSIIMNTNKSVWHYS